MTYLKDFSYSTNEDFKHLTGLCIVVQNKPDYLLYFYNKKRKYDNVPVAPGTFVKVVFLFVYALYTSVSSKALFYATFRKFGWKIE